VSAWIFDMDGTLTLAVHDFAAMKAELGLDPGLPLMEGLQALDDTRRRAAWARVEAWELALAEESLPAPGAAELLQRLHGQGVRLGVLTRNLRSVALRTLEVAGLLPWFDPEDVLGRSCYAPKPDPAGIEALLARWGVPASDAVMVGDSEIDIATGHAAGTHTVRVHADGPTAAHRAASLVTLAQEAAS
jgi:HAD superfamily hydrolase (TIGR01509 family)